MEMSGETRGVHKGHLSEREEMYTDRSRRKIIVLWVPTRSRTTTNLFIYLKN